MGSISLISTQFQFWAGQGPMLNASADQISWCRIHKHTKCVTNWAKNKKTGARLIYKQCTIFVTQFKQRLEATLIHKHTARVCETDCWTKSKARRLEAKLLPSKSRGRHVLFHFQPILTSFLGLGLHVSSQFTCGLAKSRGD